jgi:hypothetical protein
MAKDSDKLRRGFDIGETGGALSGLLADDEELDRGALWRLGTWAAVSVGAVIVALIANQSSIGVRREQSASADLLKQAQQLQLTAKESQNETRRLAAAVDTLNSDRDRLYSRVAVIEQGLDSVTGTIARQSPASTAPPAAAGQSSLQTTPGQGGAGQASTNQGNTNQGNASVTASTGPSASSASASPPAAAPTASSAPVAPATTASVDPQAPVAKPSPAPVAAAVAATAPAVVDKAAAIDKAADKQDKQTLAAIPPEPSPSVKSATDQKSAAAQPLGSLVASKSMMGPPDPAAGKLIEPLKPPNAVAAPPPEMATVAPTKAVDETGATPSAAAPELVASRTEFGVDVGGANSIPGLRALWHGLLKSRSNVALTKLRPIIVIKENNTGLGMQLRLIAGPISDAAAAAKICASLTVSDRGCTTSVFDGQRLALGADDVDKSEASKDDDKPAASASKSSSRRHSYVSKRLKDEDPPPKPQPSTLSQIFGKRQ